MAINQVNPYLNFNGNARKAIELYQAALGAKLDGDVMPFNEDPARVMHARLTIGPSLVMLSDGPPGKSVPTETNVYVSLDYSDVDEMRRAFDHLADGGNVEMALQDTFWGATFGMLSDRFGIHWMFNCNKR